MTDRERSARLSRAAAVRRQLDGFSDATISGLLNGASPGWGRSRRVVVDGVPVFVKSIPVTDLELDAGLGTSNIYAIPSYLNYPFGSPGLGAGRELSFALKTTEWIDDDVCRAFPILVHHRIIERSHEADRASSVGDYSAYREDDPSMSRYLAARSRAPARLVLLYEHFPSSAADWITRHPSDVEWILDDVRAAVHLLRSRDIVHFDVDLFNVVTDGASAFISDHGLVLDTAFDLSDNERTFLNANRHFDEGNFILSVGHHIHTIYRAQRPEVRATIDELLGLSNAPFETCTARLLEEVNQLEERGLLPVDARLRRVLDQHHDVIAFMHAFYASARANWSSETLLDDHTLANLLTRCR